MNKSGIKFSLFVAMFALSLSASAKLPPHIIAKLFSPSVTFKSSGINNNTDTATATVATSTMRLAKYDGQFRTNKHTGDWVKANDVIGEIYYGGIWNRQFAKTNGQISYILSNGTIAKQNKTSLCVIHPLDDHNTVSLAAPF